MSVAYFANDWGFFTFAVCAPLYMHDVLGFNMTRNGLFSALPFLLPILLQPVNGMLADWLRSPGRLSTTVVRKAFCVVGFALIGSLLIAVGYIGCDRTLAVATLCGIVASESISYTSVAVNQLDLAPLHAGKIMGLTHNVVVMSAIVAPLAVGALTYERSTRDEWQKVFFLAAGVYAVGAIVYLIFSSGERQSWSD